MGVRVPLGTPGKGLAEMRGLLLCGLASGFGPANGRAERWFRVVERASGLPRNERARVPTRRRQTGVRDNGPWACSDRPLAEAAHLGAGVDGALAVGALAADGGHHHGGRALDRSGADAGG